MNKLPDRPKPDGPPSRRLTNEQFELVIRRAVELQTRSAEGPGGEGLSEEEVVRIGRELGLSGPHLGQALAEVRGGAAEDTGLAAKLMGASCFAAWRAVPGDAADVGRVLESYLVEREYLVVQRRFSDRTVFVRASGVLAVVARATTGMFRRSPLLEIETLEVSIRQLDPGTSFVGLATDLAGDRTGHLVGGAAMVGVSGVGALALGIAIAPAAALLGIPIVAASLGGIRYAYRDKGRKVVMQLEALLDRLEHDELDTPS